LKESVEEMQQSLMQISSNGRWFSTQILQDVMIDGKTLYYKIPPLLKKLNSAPERYYHVSLRMNARFRSKYAHAMYELLRENLWKHESGEMHCRNSASAWALKTLNIRNSSGCRRG
jgi:hypothetical protein